METVQFQCKRTCKTWRGQKSIVLFVAEAWKGREAKTVLRTRRQQRVGLEVKNNYGAGRRRRRRRGPRHVRLASTTTLAKGIEGLLRHLELRENYGRSEGLSGHNQKSSMRVNITVFSLENRLSSVKTLERTTRETGDPLFQQLKQLFDSFLSIFEVV